MFRGDLLIDGYNLLHAAGLAQRDYGPGEFEQTRRRLLKLLANQLCDRECRRTTVVFDAPAQTLGPSPPTEVHGIRVIFAGGDGDADAAIERLISRNSAPRRLHVISSDRRVQQAARRRKANFHDSEAFLKRIARRPTPEERARHADPPEKRHGLMAPGEVNAWLTAFADVQTLANEAPVPAIPPRTSVLKISPPADVANSDEARPAAEHPPESVQRDELSFWERRIAELWNHTDAADRS